jgi:hypothetical protein
MEYKHGTILSFGNKNSVEGGDNNYQEAIVITNGKVFINTLDSKPCREIMLLADWLIINKNQNINIITPDSPISSEASKKKFNYKPRSLIRWFGKDSRRTAVVLYEGALLQLKKVDGNVVIKDNTFFTSYDEWAATFPSKGEVYYYKY